MNSNILNLNIFRKDNMVCILLVNEICLNSIGEPNVPDLRNCISVPKFYSAIKFRFNYYFGLYELCIKMVIILSNESNWSSTFYPYVILVIVVK